MLGRPKRAMTAASAANGSASIGGPARVSAGETLRVHHGTRLAPARVPSCAGCVHSGALALAASLPAGRRAPQAALSTSLVESGEVRVAVRKQVCPSIVKAALHPPGAAGVRRHAATACAGRPRRQRGRRSTRRLVSRDCSRAVLAGVGRLSGRQASRRLPFALPKEKWSISVTRRRHRDADALRSARRGGHARAPLVVRSGSRLAGRGRVRSARRRGTRRLLSVHSTGDAGVLRVLVARECRVRECRITWRRWFRGHG